MAFLGVPRVPKGIDVYWLLRYRQDSIFFLVKFQQC